ncbi:unnamed protein product, partial [Amoebophrya sp. A25]|eukprot:GSA25T00025204001.1
MLTQKRFQRDLTLFRSIVIGLLSVALTYGPFSSLGVGRAAPSQLPQPVPLVALSGCEND